VARSGSFAGVVSKSSGRESSDPVPYHRVLVVGSVNMDLVTRVPGIPGPGETVLGSAFKTIPGGKGANQAVAAARLGAETAFIGRVGDDAFGVALRKNLAAEGVDLSALRVDRDHATGAASILVDDAGENAIALAPGANAALTPADLEAEAARFAWADVLLVQMEIPSETAAAALRLAAQHDALGILDIGSDRAVPEAVVRAAGIVSPNASEAERMTALQVKTIEEAQIAAEAIRGLGAREVTLKLGGLGCLYHGAQSVHAPAFTVNVVDTTAAGDAFTAALGVEWRDTTIAEALRFANAAGALAATVAGAQPAMPTRAAVEAFLRDAPRT